MYMYYIWSKHVDFHLYVKIIHIRNTTQVWKYRVMSSDSTRLCPRRTNIIEDWTGVFKTVSQDDKSFSKNRDNDILMSLREIIQITELSMYFLQLQCENSWNLSSDLFKMIDFITN